VALVLIGSALAERRRGKTALQVTKHWWLKTSTGFDAKTTKRGGGRNEQGCAHRIKDWQRRESRRRGEEDFRHDVDNFELMTTNLIRAPGDIHVSHTKAYCRSKFGHRGRSAGKGRKGAGVRGRRTMHPNWEGGGKFPYHLRMPKISLEERRRFKHDGYERITFNSLNLLSDGEEAEFQDLRMRGLMVMEQGRMREWIQHDVKTKVVCKDENEELTAKNLKVYAHKFDPLAREKIEAEGGQCIRLDEETNLPIEAEYVKIDSLFD
jgi:ribosomal protein L15